LAFVIFFLGAGLWINSPTARVLTTDSLGAPEAKENNGLSHLRQLFFHSQCDKLVT
jgi:hypothetical protein